MYVIHDALIDASDGVRDVGRGDPQRCRQVFGHPTICGSPMLLVDKVPNLRLDNLEISKFLKSSVWQVCEIS